MIIVRLQGGLGNQMFQYAAGLRLAMNNRTELKLDLQTLLDRKPRENLMFRDYDLDLFQIPEPKATPAETRKFLRITDPGARSFSERIEDKLVRRYLFQEQTFHFDPQVMRLPARTYLDGYFQNEKYFADIESTVRERFQFPFAARELPDHTRTLVERIQATNSVCVNVRRGDYVSNPISAQYHGVCGIDYFANAAAWFGERLPTPSFFVFSDDPDWCRDNLKLPGETSFVGSEYNGPRFFNKFWLMSQCKHFIIPNSSFGWWAAWLANHPVKQVLRPSNWFRAPEVRDVDICPSSWVKIANT